jgi:hypothetical protein
MGCLLVSLCVVLNGSGARAGDLFAVAPAPGAFDGSTQDTFRTLNTTDLRVRWLALADRPLGSISTAYTSVSVTAPRRVAAAPVADSKDAPALNDAKTSVYTSGEAGFLYGHSAGGRHSFDTEQGYIFGQAGNDNFQISVGAAYQELNTHGFRGRR